MTDARAHLFQFGGGDPDWPKGVVVLASQEQYSTVMANGAKNVRYDLPIGLMIHVPQLEYWNIFQSSLQLRPNELNSITKGGF